MNGALCCLQHYFTSIQRITCLQSKVNLEDPGNEAL